MTVTSLEPSFIVDTDGRILDGVVVTEHGVVRSIEKAAPAGALRILLKNKMLLLGFVNVHSHALQRALRGRVETRSPQGVDNFWTWRTLMYRDASRASLDDIEAIASLAYFEMLQSGYVAVGEFNYLHHQPDGTPYKDATAIGQRLMKAAERVGLRQCLLTCAYERKNYKEALLPEQQRFGLANAQAFLAHAAHIQKEVQSPLLTHGLAIHSTRACSRPMIEAICQSELAAQGPLHMHASEQLGEVEEAQAEYGLTPIAALAEFGALSPRTTLVHATHLTKADIALIAKAKSLVALCPSTERNLGDGLCPIEDLLESDVRLAIGSDQHVRLDPVRELCEIEEQERLRLQKRCVTTLPGHSVAQSLLKVGTLHGRQSLALSNQGGLLGGSADLVAIRLPLSYECAGPVAALNEWLVAGTRHDVSDVFVAGLHKIKDGEPTMEVSDVKLEAMAALKRLN